MGGEFSSYKGTPSGRVIRLNPDATVDTATVGTGFINTVFALVEAPDGSGKLYAGGSFTSFSGQQVLRVARLNANMSLDTAFDTLTTGLNTTVNALTIAPGVSGDIYAGGSLSIYKGVTSNRIVRINPDASADTLFTVGFDNPVNTLAVAADGLGDIYVGGTFGFYNSQTNNRIIRLSADGTKDTAFDIGTGFNSDVNALAVATDGSGILYVGGNFTTYKGLPSNRIIRLNATGAAD